MTGEGETPGIEAQPPSPNSEGLASPTSHPCRAGWDLSWGWILVQLVLSSVQSCFLLLPSHLFPCRIHWSQNHSLISFPHSNLYLRITSLWPNLRQALYPWCSIMLPNSASVYGTNPSFSNQTWTYAKSHWDGSLNTEVLQRNSECIMLLKD